MACQGKIDPALQARYQREVGSWRYAGSAGRSLWWSDGKAAAWLNELAAAVRAEAPSFGLPPRPTDLFVVAHAAMSSGYGRSLATQLTHNTWGVKCGANWTGPVLRTGATEFDEDDREYPVTAEWRIWPSWREGVRSYLDLVTSAPRYAKAAAMLRAADQGYMAELGRAGWYTGAPARASSMWRAVQRKISPIIGTPLAPLQVDTGSVVAWALAGLAAALVAGF